MNKEKIKRIHTTPDYWDCECETNYIHSKSETVCDKCGATREESPDARVEEVFLRYGITSCAGLLMSC